MMMTEGNELIFATDSTLSFLEKLKSETSKRSLDIEIKQNDTGTQALPDVLNIVTNISDCHEKHQNIASVTLYSNLSDSAIQVMHKTCPKLTTCKL
jgi:hypothetical protein